MNNFLHQNANTYWPKLKKQAGAELCQAKDSLSGGGWVAGLSENKAS